MSVFCAAHPNGAPGPCLGCANARILSQTPPRVARTFGRFFTGGFTDGIREDIPYVADAGRAAAQAALSSGEAPDFSGLAWLSPRNASSTWSPTFAITPDPGPPLADQVFAAAQRLREKKAEAEAEATRTMFYAEDNKMTSRMVIRITIAAAALAVLAAVAAALVLRFWGQA